MRLWSLHPKYLDASGLLALWREGLLAEKVLRGNARGYLSHPQLERFRAHPYPLGAIGAYLLAVSEEACLRGYSFNRSKISVSGSRSRPIEVTEGQMRYEISHLSAKMKRRDPGRLELLDMDDVPRPHPCFLVVPGPIAPWERVGV